MIDYEFFAYNSIKNSVDVIDDIDCSVRFIFSKEEKVKKFDREAVIPAVVLRELENFFGNVDEFHIKPWNLMFSSFAYGIIRSGSILISSRGGRDFDENVYACSDLSNRQRILDKIVQDRIFLQSLVVQDAGLRG